MIFFFHSSLPQINIFIVEFRIEEDEAGKGKDLNVEIDMKEKFSLSTRST